MAFLLCGGFSDLGGMREHRYGVPHTLIGRYATKQKIFYISLSLFLALSGHLFYGVGNSALSD
ncbi:TPA: hypothetical protein RG687_003739 [Vibrio parahaemolyticus]|nr:hypothetical protein [Vibrio parahaemolyticus]